MAVGPNHQSEFYGDVHSYLYDADNWDPTVFKKPRFMSEFGLQSWPAALTMASFLPPSEQYWSSEMMTNRNHHGDGQNQIMQQIAMHYHLPNMSPQPDPKAQYVAWSQMLWLSQVNQAYGYKVEVEHLRRLRTTCSSQEPGCTMGMMYWQTNDIWPGASWAAIDWTGRYKMVQYFTKRFYAPFLVSPFVVHGSSFTTFVVNDHVDTAFNGTLTFTLHSWAKGRLSSWTSPFAAPPASAASVYQTTLEQVLQLGGCGDPTECVLTVAANDHTGTLLSDNYVYLAPFYDVTTAACGDVSWKCSNITIHSITSADAQTLDVTLSVAAVTPFLWLETAIPGHFSDNGMLVVQVDTPFTIQFFPDEQGVSPSDLHDSLTKEAAPGGGMWSLFDTSKEYHSQA